MACRSDETLDRVEDAVEPFHTCVALVVDRVVSILPERCDYLRARRCDGIRLPEVDTGSALVIAEQKRTGQAKCATAAR